MKRKACKLKPVSGTITEYACRDWGKPRPVSGSRSVPVISQIQSRGATYSTAKFDFPLYWCYRSTVAVFIKAFKRKLFSLFYLNIYILTPWLHNRGLLYEKWLFFYHPPPIAGFHNTMGVIFRYKFSATHSSRSWKSRGTSRLASTLRSLH
jgi:hypothetical protein